MPFSVTKYCRNAFSHSVNFLCMQARFGGFGPSKMATDGRYTPPKFMNGNLQFLRVFVQVRNLRFSPRISFYSETADKTSGVWLSQPPINPTKNSPTLPKTNNSPLKSRHVSFLLGGVGRFSGVNC